MAEVAWTFEAKRWLQEIYDYIADDDRDAAYRTVSAIHARAEILLTYPDLGYRYRTDSDVRVLLYGHYRIAYLKTEAGGIEVLGVFHGALDIRRYLG